MRRNVITFLGTVLVMTLTFSSLVYGDTLQTVSLTNADELVYQEDATELANAFVGMAPGDTRTAAIRIENHNDHEAGFYISGTTTKALESINEKARGGAYEFDLSVGTDEASAVSLLNAVAGGYDSAMHASGDGLAEITELKDYQFLAKLKKNEFVNVYLTLHLDGEGLDSSVQTDYTDAVGQLAFQFRAYYGEKTEPTVIEKTVVQKGATSYIRQIVDQMIPLAGSVKTGDAAPLWLMAIMFVAGAIMLITAFRKRKADKK